MKKTAIILMAFLAIGSSSTLKASPDFGEAFLV